MQPRLLVYIEPFADPVALERLEACRDIELLQLDLSARDEFFWKSLGRAHGIQVPTGTFLNQKRYGSGVFVTAALLELCPDLLGVAVLGAGYDTVDVATCTTAGVLVMNQTGLGKESVAEHVFAMLIGLSKQMVQSDRAMRRDRAWTRSDYQGTDIFGRTLGIIGLGHIGGRVAEIARAFSMPVLACDPCIGDETFAALGAARVDLDTLLSRSDFVTVHTPLTAETEGMIGARELGLMKPTAIFVNAARGGIHDEAALAEALVAGRIAGAGLDVWRPEPPNLESPLLAFDNVFATPHNAGCTYEAFRALAEGAVEQWLALLCGHRPPRVVNPEAWPGHEARARRLLGVAPAF